MKRVLDEIDAAACLLDEEGRIAVANDRLATATGRSVDELSGAPLGSVLLSPSAPLSALEGDTGSVAAVLDDGEGGRSRTLDLSRVEAADAAYLAVFRREEWIPPTLRRTLSAAPVGAFALRADGSVGLWNDAMEELLGWTESDVLGERPPFVPPGARDAWHSLRERAAAGETVREAELHVRTATRTPTTVSASAAPIGDGRDRGVLVVATDTGRQARRERQLELLDRVMRHNIRNEMNLALGQADRLRDRLEDPELLAIVDDVIGATEEVRDLSEKARTLKRVIESADTTEIVRVTEVVTRVVGEYRERHPEVTFEVEPGVEATARASPLLAAAVENLVENAVEHNDEDPHVWVSVATEWTEGREVVEVRVADDGPPIPDHERRVLAEEHVNVLRHGSGIGLWLVYWIVKESNSELVYDARDPRGNELTMRLPRGIPDVD